MVQIEMRIAITFQSTILNASSSFMTPSQIMAATPSSAAAVLSIQPVMTTMMVTVKMAIASQVRGSIGMRFLSLVGRGDPPAAGTRLQQMLPRVQTRRKLGARSVLRIVASRVVDARSPIDLGQETSGGRRQ